MSLSTLPRAIVACAAALALHTAASGQNPATSPFIQYDADIQSLDLTWEGDLPLAAPGTGAGQGAVYMFTRVRATLATDHNSSRSNKSSSNAVAPDTPPPIDLDELAGLPMEFVGEADLKFDLTFEDIDDNADFAQGLGDTPGGSLEAPALLSGGPTFSFSLDSDDICPRGCVPEAPVGALDGHVTVLKIALGGGGGDIELGAQGITFELTPNTSSYRELQGGLLEHTVDVTMSLTGTYNNNPFFIDDSMSGTMVERGALANQLVPEPTSLILATLAGLSLVAGRRR